MKKVPINELGLATDEEAITFVKKFRNIGKSIFYFTDGEKERYFVGELEDMPLISNVVSARLAVIEEKFKANSITLEKMEEKLLKLEETVLQLQKGTNIVQKISELPKPEEKEEPKQLSFEYVERSDELTPVETNKVSFKCKNCGNEFSGEVEKGKSIVEVKCPKCGAKLYSKRLSKKVKVGIAAGSAVALFLVWLFFL